MKTSVKVEIRKKARACNGLLNLLKDDIERITMDANEFDLICLDESIKDAIGTLQVLTDKVKEMEYNLYLFKQDCSSANMTMSLME